MVKNNKLFHIKVKRIANYFGTENLPPYSSYSSGNALIHSNIIDLLISQKKNQSQ